MVSLRVGAALKLPILSPLSDVSSFKFSFMHKSRSDFQGSATETVNLIDVFLKREQRIYI